MPGIVLPRAFSPNDERNALLAAAFLDHPTFCRHSLSIRNKRGLTVPLNLTPAQIALDEAINAQELVGKPVRLVVLKARQVHMSVGCAAEFFHRIPFRTGKRGFVLAHLERAAAQIADYYLQFQHSYQPFGTAETQIILPPLDAKPTTEGLRWENGSKIDVGTAGSVEIGRSFSCHYLHLSEFAFYRDASTLMTGLMQTIPYLPETMVIVESTANGVGGPFYELCQQAIVGDADWRFVFFAWWEHPEYSMPLAADVRTFEQSLTAEERVLRQQHHLTLEQLHWRRWCIANNCQGSADKFRQEYPACVTADTRVSTERGIIPISEAGGAWQSESGKIKAWGPQPVSRIYQLTTKCGRILRGTFDHPVATPDGFVYLSRLLPGQAITLRPPMFCGPGHLQRRWNLIGGAEGVVTVDENWGAFLGYFMGDGSWHRDVLSIVCDENDEDVCTHVAGLLTCLIAPPQARTIRKVKGRKGALEWRVGCKRAREVFNELGLLYRNDGGEGSWKRKVHVPECIFRSQRPVVREFLRSLFECDGSASGDVVRFGSCKLDFVRDVQLLLLGFGINSTISSNPKKAGSGGVYKFYALTLRSEASRLFHDEVGFVGARKSSKRKAKSTHGGRPPLPNLMVDEVLKVEEQGCEVTYDLTVEPGHVFSANGILTHNTPEEAFLTSGRPRFDHISIAKQPIIRDPLNGDLETIRVGTESRIQFVARGDGRGPLRIWKRPVAGHVYAIGADPAQGIDAVKETGVSDPDYSCACVLDGDTGEQVAVLRERLAPSAFGAYLCALGRWYNDAYLIPEANPIGIALIEEIRRQGYPLERIYKRRRDASDRRPVRLEEIGFLTTTTSKPQLISSLDTALREMAVIVRDPLTIQECRTYVWDARGHTNGQSGCHDDLVIALALAITGLMTMPRAVLTSRAVTTGGGQYGVSRNRRDDD